MVTAILIPIICFYFYWKTKKEIKENDKEWGNLINIKEEAIVSGKVISLVDSKKKFYYHRYIQVTDIQLLLDTKTISVKRIIPYTKQEDTFDIKCGDYVRLYGNWQENDFRFLRYEKIGTAEK